MKQPVLVCYGGGTNSTAMLIELVNRCEPVDLILFANTGGEFPRTLRYVMQFNAWLRLQGYPAITWVLPRDKAGEIITLEDDCLERESLPGIVFGFKSCSDRFKQRPQHNFVNVWQPALDVWATCDTVIKCIGFDADESHRAKPSPDALYTNRFPLLEWNWGRDECVRAIQVAGLQQPGKSACFFCPSSTKHEVIVLSKEYPKLFDRAVEMERRALPKLTNIDGLGRHWSWADVVDADRNQVKMFDDAGVTIPCECYD